MKKKNKGITLIALVITIIVLLILAGVALSLVAGNEGILTKAETAVTETNEEAAKEQAELMVAEISADYYEKRYVNRDATVSSQKIKEYIAGQIGTAGKASSNGDYVIKVEDGKVTVSDEAGNEIASGTLEESGKVSWSETAGGSGSGGSGEGGSGSVGETYYGDSSVVPTDAKYFTFTINEDGQTATITGIKDEYADLTYYKDNTGTIRENDSIPCAINDNGTYITDVVIPYEYVDENNNKYIVTTIGKSAFGADSEYTTGTVGWGSMYEEKENSFTGFLIPNTITTIGELAFAGQPKLSKVDILYGTTNIEKMAFRNCRKLISVNIANSVTTIGDQVFESCESLSNINIPDSVTSIGSKVFYKCSCLKELNVNNEVYSSQDGIIYDTQNENIIAVPGGIMGEITIPNGVTSIGVGAFVGCASLSSINIPESVTSIEINAFNGCTSLSSINIPKSVTSIGQQAFFECTSLSSINIPESVTSIEFNAFNECTNLTSVTIDSATIASGLTSQTVYGNLIKNATTIYIKSGLTVRSYVTTNFTEGTSDKEGYVMYTKN